MTTTTRTQGALPRVTASAWNDRCTGCMVGQGDSCACRGETPRARVSRRRVHITPTEWLWLLIAVDVACLWGAVKLVQVALS